MPHSEKVILVVHTPPFLHRVEQYTVVNDVYERESANRPISSAFQVKVSFSLIWFPWMFVPSWQPYSCFHNNIRSMEKASSFQVQIQSWVEYKPIQWNPLFRNIGLTYMKRNHITFPILFCSVGGGGRFVKLMAYGARGLWFEYGSRHFDFRDLVSDWKIVKA